MNDDTSASAARRATDRDDTGMRGVIGIGRGAVTSTGSHAEEAGEASRGRRLLKGWG